MGEGTTDAFRLPEASLEDVLRGILREGAQRLLAEAVEAEVAAYIEANQHVRDEQRPAQGQAEEGQADAARHLDGRDQG